MLLDLEPCVSGSRDHYLSDLHPAEVWDRDLLPTAEHIVMSVPRHVVAASSLVIEEIPVHDVGSDSPVFHRSRKIELDESLDGHAILFCDRLKTLCVPSFHCMPREDVLVLRAVTFHKVGSQIGVGRSHHSNHGSLLLNVPGLLRIGRREVYHRNKSLRHFPCWTKLRYPVLSRISAQVG